MELPAGASPPPYSRHAWRSPGRSPLRPRALLAGAHRKNPAAPSASRSITPTEHTNASHLLPGRALSTLRPRTSHRFPQPARLHHSLCCLDRRNKATAGGGRARRRRGGFVRARGGPTRSSARRCCGRGPRVRQLDVPGRYRSLCTRQHVLDRGWGRGGGWGRGSLRGELRSLRAAGAQPPGHRPA